MLHPVHPKYRTLDAAISDDRRAGSAAEGEDLLFPAVPRPLVALLERLVQRR